MKIFALIFFLVVTACTGKRDEKPAAPPPVPPDIDFKACAKSSDCIKVPDLCGSENAINKKFLREYQEQMAATKAKCAESLRPKKRHTVDCVAESCTLIGD